MKRSELKIGVIGLGYVGLPLAVEFGKSTTIPVKGYDRNSTRILELQSNTDKTGEVDESSMILARTLKFTDDISDLKDCNFYIVAVPTPVDKYHCPDLTPLRSATEAVATVMNKGDIVVFESTVYPGATEEVCVPIISRISNLKFNSEFFVGYSPERINPGDKEHRLSSIVKITSGSTPETSDFVDKVYREIITVGTHKTSSIRVAEAAKVIENTQRDVNIAFMNELSLIFNRLELSTKEILEAAGTKWNFLPFRPGLVGGHCISVDPYYLTYKSREIGYTPEIISAGRRINDDMGKVIASDVIKLLSKRELMHHPKVLILGFTFKENCPDVRNTRVIDIIKEFHQYSVEVDVTDPLADKNEVSKEYGITLSDSCDKEYDAVILAVAHTQFIHLTTKKLRELVKPTGVIYDVKQVFPSDQVDGQL